MEFKIIQRKDVEVFIGNELFLFCKVKSFLGFKAKMKFYYKENWILESSYLAFFFRRYVKIKNQNLKYPITILLNGATFEFSMQYNSSILTTKKNWIRKPCYTFYINGEKKAELFNVWKLFIAKAEYTLNTRTEDEETNLYILISFLMRLKPIFS
jgi:hypothetical protein